MNKLIFVVVVAFLGSVSAKRVIGESLMGSHDNPKISAVVRVAEQRYNAEINSIDYYIVKTILKWEYVIFGAADYSIDVLFAQTDCKKPLKPNVLCEELPEGQKKKVRITAYVNTAREMETCTFKNI
uniref:Cystatin domain-containing protein n=1 Tax=Panagrellus redivivus TaxID=6233 RepID=A0A7E4VK17_PANRE